MAQVHCDVLLVTIDGLVEYRQLGVRNEGRYRTYDLAVGMFHLDYRGAEIPEDAAGHGTRPSGGRFNDDDPV